MVYVVFRIANSKLLLIKQIAAETARLIAEKNANIISLAQGSPNLSIFPAAAKSMIELIESGKLPYTDVPGLATVRDTAALFANEYYSANNRFIQARPAEESKSIITNQYKSMNFTKDNVMITTGAAQAVYNSLALSIECKDDIVISPLPAYGLYKHQTELLGGTFVPIQTQYSNQFIPTISELQAIFDQYTVTDTVNNTVTNKIRSLVLCFPNNPCGTTLSVQQCIDIAEFLDQQLIKFSNTGPGFSIILDEVYIGIERSHHSIINYCTPLVLNNIFLVLSCSKGLGAMPGARSGLLYSADTALIQHCIKIQAACTANSSIISQYGLKSSLEYLLANPTEINTIYQHYTGLVEYATERLNTMGKLYLNGHSIVKQYNSNNSKTATFYILADFNCQELSTQFPTDIDIQVALRDEYMNGIDHIGVAVVPGAAFALDSTLRLIRFSCAISKEQLELALNVIEKWIQRVTKK